MHHAVSILLTLLIFLIEGICAVGCRNEAIAQNKLGSMLRAETYSYNALNRLTGLGISRSAGVSPTSLQGYSYTLNKNGHRSQISELSGRVITNTFDKLHRLTAEGISQSGPGILPGALTHPTGTLSYSYDAVGNRQSRTTSGPIAQLILNQSQAFTANDRLTSDTYDANGNTTSSQGVANSASPSSLTDIYSFDNKSSTLTTLWAAVAFAGKHVGFSADSDFHTRSGLNFPS